MAGEWILIADDDREIVRAISLLLEKEGYQTLAAYDGQQALDQALSRDVRLMILDVMMPHMDGLTALVRLREQKNIPVIVLSAKTEETDKILGLSLGADDYVTKPFAPMEVVARVRSHLRRYTSLGGMNAPTEQGEIVNGRLRYSPEGRQLLVDGQPVHLTATECRIMELFMGHPGRVFSTEEIYERVWKEPAYAADKTVMVHIRRIREKIEINPREPEYVKVVWGIGYKMEKH